jgi:hypothetical protein
MGMRHCTLALFTPRPQRSLPMRKIVAKLRARKGTAFDVKAF